MLQNRLLLYLLAVHLGVGGLLAFLFWGRPWLLAVEAGLVISMVVGWRLIEALFVPLRLVQTGTGLIRERDFTTTFVPTGQREMDRLIEVYNRMIEALREERRRGREQEEFLDRLIEASPAGVLICDLDGAVTRLNPAARRLLDFPGPGEEPDRPDVPGGTSWNSLELFQTPWREALSGLEEGQSITVSLPDSQRVRCRAAAFRDRGFQRRFVLFEELSEELRRSEKAAYEKLIRMISHEVNNSAGAVSSLLGAFGHYSPQLEEEDREDFEAALEVGSGRLARLTSFIDAFAAVVRLPPPSLAPVALDSLVEDLLVLYRPSLENRRIELVRRRKGSDSAKVLADRQQIEQVLINVLKNAAEAIDSDGTVEVVTELAEGRVALTVSDDGPGLDSLAAAELFTPFFSTKPEGQGLGLTLVQEILNQHGARFSLESLGSGAGCRFSVSFPAHASSDEDAERS